MLYRARAEFHLTSRIPWTDAASEMRDHLDDLVVALRLQPALGEVVVDGDPARSWVVVELVFHAAKTDPDPEHDARVMLSKAIIDIGGRHEELLPIAEESRAKPRGNAWSGLRTPRWSARVFRLEVMSES